MCEIYFDESAELLRESHPKARKKHKCKGCGGPINPGEVYLIRVSLFDSQITEDKLCNECEKDSNRFFREHGVGWVTNGWLEWLDECVVGDGEGADPEWVQMLERAKERRNSFNV